MSVIQRLRRETGAAGAPGTAGLSGQFAVNFTAAEPVLYAAQPAGTWVDVLGPTKARLTTAEGNITNLQGRMTTAEGNITSLDGRLDTLEPLVATHTTQITALQNADVALDGRLDAIEAAGYVTEAPMTGQQYARQSGAWSVITVVAATETVAGIAEIATQDEVTTGTDNARIVTPLKLAQKLTAFTVNPATETVAGIAEIATYAEVAANTDDARIVTPLKLNQRLGGTVVSGFSAQNGSGPLFTGAQTTMTWPTEVFDLAGDFDGATGVFTARYTGKYRFSFALNGIASASGSVWSFYLITSNRAYATSYNVPNTNVSTFSGSWLVDMEAGDTAKIDVVRALGTANLQLHNDDQWNYFQGELIGSHSTGSAPTVSGFSATTATALVFNSGTPTTVTGWGELFDLANDFDNTTGVFTARYNGKYRFSFNLMHDGSVTVGDTWHFMLNTSNRAYSIMYRVVAAANQSVGSSWIVDMEAGDTAQLQVLRNPGTGQFKLFADGQFNWFQCELVGGSAGAIASQAEVNAGMEVGKAITPATLRNFAGRIVGDVQIGAGGSGAATARCVVDGGPTGYSVLDFKANNLSRWEIGSDPTAKFFISRFNKTTGAWIDIPFQMDPDTGYSTFGQPVGIGGTPAAPLHIQWAGALEVRLQSTVAGQYANLQLKTTDKTFNIYNSGTGGFFIDDLTVGATRLSISTTGVVTALAQMSSPSFLIDSNFYVSKAAGTKPVLNFDAFDYIIYDRSTDNMRFSNGSDRLEIATYGVAVAPCLHVGSGFASVDSNMTLQINCTTDNTTVYAKQTVAGRFAEYRLANTDRIWAMRVISSPTVGALEFVDYSGSRAHAKFQPDGWTILNGGCQFYGDGNYYMGNSGGTQKWLNFMPGTYVGWRSSDNKIVIFVDGVLRASWP